MCVVCNQARHNSCSVARFLLLALWLAISSYCVLLFSRRLPREKCQFFFLHFHFPIEDSGVRVFVVVRNRQMSARNFRSVLVKGFGKINETFGRWREELWVAHERREKQAIEDESNSHRRRAKHSLSLYTTEYILSCLQTDDL